MSLPRYFVARPEKKGAAPGPAIVAHAFDCLVIRRRGASGEWVVGLGDGGELTAQPVVPRSALREAVQAQLAYHEAAGRRTRVLAVESLYLFEVGALAHAPDLPGINDPLYLQGSLIGPLEPGAAVHRRSGQLTVTRADILHGLVAGAPAAFLHADPVVGKTTRTFHALLPGDREEVLAEGHGGVLAYPSTGCEPALAGPGNESAVDEILYNVLMAVWRDVAFEHPPPLRRADDLPVPSRSTHELQLISRGFKISGNRAVRTRKGRLGWLRPERRKLPPQGSTNVFLDLAQEALQLLPHWPAPRIAALTSPWPPRPAPPPSPPRASVPPPPPPPRVVESTAELREKWLKRFTEAQDARQKLRDRGSKPEGE